MATTDKTIGTIGAINTLIKNFPMNILDNSKGKVYTSAFDFIMDILYLCGVNTSEITEFLLKEIYSTNIRIDDIKSNVENNYLNDNILNEQNPFLENLEDGIKEILMGLLSSVFTCSAIPEISNKYIDIPTFNTGLTIPISYIDPMGILEISPTTNEGRMYYMVEGRDIYCKKELVENTATSTFSLLRERSINNIALFLTLNSENNIIFELETPIFEDLNISVGYIAYNDDNLCKWKSVILAGETKADKIFYLKPQINNSQKSQIKWIKINNQDNGYKTFDGNWIYLNSDKSNSVINLWEETNANTIKEYVKWDKGYISNTNILSVSQNNTYTYKECGYSKESRDAVRVLNKIETPDENSPEYIVYYEGITPNDLYKTMDMNAFIWYCIRRGVTTPQIEYNHMMWDNRLPAAKANIKRNSNTEWNNWYNSKTNENGEFMRESSFYPILQLKPINNGYHNLNITFPKQTYYKENKFNASIYKFNREYLESIQILKPKLMLTGLCKYLLGFSLTEISSTKVDLTKKIIESKLSTVIKKIIEADDMEINDCYFNFSNEKYDELLKDMLISRYDATYYGGESTILKQHDVNDYINRINSISDNVEKVDTHEIITKLVNDITSDPATEGSINYGIQLSTDSNLLNKIIWAITMPIVESLFTPQVMLLLYINYFMTGIVKLDNSANNNLGVINNLLFNKILGLTKSIIRYIKDKIIELLLKLFYEKVIPLLSKYTLLLLSERNSSWIEILTTALACLPKMQLQRKRNIISSIDNVDYADITTIQSIPESSTGC